MARFDYISSGIVLSEFGIKYSESNEYFDEDLAKIALDEGVDALLTADSMKTYVALLDLNHHGKVQAPINFKYPLQIAYRDRPSKSLSLTNNNRILVTKWLGECKDDPSHYIDKSDDCPKCKKPICCCNSDLKYTNNYIHNQAVNVELNTDNDINILSGYTVSTVIVSSNKYRSNINQDFTIIRPTSNYFFNLPREIQGCQIPDIDELLEYNIDNKIIEVNNFINYNNYTINNSERYGQILISYLGYNIDDEGFLLVPNERYVVKALEDYLILFFAKRRYNFKPTQMHRAFWMDMKQESMVSMSKAKSKLRRLDMDEWNEVGRQVLKNRNVNSPVNRSGKYTPDVHNPHLDALSIVVDQPNSNVIR